MKLIKTILTIQLFFGLAAHANKTSPLDQVKELNRLVAENQVDLSEVVDYDIMLKATLPSQSSNDDEATSQQKAELSNTFKNFVNAFLNKWQTHLDSSNAKYLSLASHSPRIQKVQVDMDGKSTLPVTYHLKFSRGAWKIFDVTVDDISFVLTYRLDVANATKISGDESLDAISNHLLEATKLLSLR